jgi:hypothetical protein
MNIGGLAILFLFVCGGIFGLYVIFNNVNMSAPVDSSGNTVNISQNMTRINVTNISTKIGYEASILPLIVGALILFSAIIFLVQSRHKFQSRY